MPLYVQGPGSMALHRRVEAMRSMVRPGSRALTAVRQDLRQAVYDDHIDMLLAGVDDRGQVRAPLAPSTIAHRRSITGRTGGPSLIPGGRGSRFITNVEVIWQRQYQAASVLVKRFRDMAFAVYHFTGTSRMPRRDVSGISPRGWAKIIALHRAFATRVAQAGGRAAGGAASGAASGAAGGVASGAGPQQGNVSRCCP
jgi:hypothetical protein